MPKLIKPFNFKDIDNIYKNGCFVRPEDEIEYPAKEIPESLYVLASNSKCEWLTLQITWDPLSFLITVRFRFHLNTITYEYIFSEKRSQYINEYRIGGLSLLFIKPLRKCLIKFKGFCKTNNNEYKYIKLNMIAFGISNIYEPYMNDTWFYAKKFKNFNTNYIPSFYSQNVNIKGILRNGSDKKDTYEFYLWGLRTKCFTSENKAKITSIFSAYSKLGFSVCIYNIKAEDDKNYQIGYCTFSSQRVDSISEDITINLKDELINNKNDILFSVKGKSEKYHLCLTKYKEIYKITINNASGCAILYEINELQSQIPNKRLNLTFTDDNQNDLVVDIDNLTATNEMLTGGKGSSLSQLVIINKDLNDPSFCVPNAIIVTTKAYELLLKENDHLVKLIDKLEDSIYRSENSTEKLEVECNSLVDLISSTDAPNKIKNEIKYILNKKYGEKLDEIKFALRSSACGEDSENMSAAGQLSTFLGIKGLDKIYKFLMKCWSSQFRLIACKYKKNHGESINSYMAVVIQEMIDCDKAGVLFTCDPVTNDQSTIVIASNYGLGESVVSASSEPDTIKLDVEYQENKGLIVKGIKMKQIGSKKIVIKLNEDDSGTYTKENTKQNEFSLKEEEAIKLAETSLKINSYYSSPRDLEWGIKDNIIYLLQCRPVTNWLASDEWEIAHELDTGHSSEDEIFTRVNFAEVLSGALSYAFHDHIFQIWGREYLKVYKDLIPNFKYVPYTDLGFGRVNGFLFLNLSEHMLNFKENRSVIDKAMIISIFGRDIYMPEATKKSEMRKFRPTFYMKCFFLYKVLHGFIFSSRNINRNIESFSFNKDSSSSEIFESIITDTSKIIGKKFIQHYACTLCSTYSTFLIIYILLKNNTDENTLSDFALLLSSCQNVISAQVPIRLAEIANKINDVDLFKNLSNQDIVKYLTDNKSEASKLYLKFIDEYGHRGIREFDMRYRVWRQNPEMLILTIKKLVDNKITIKEPMDMTKHISQIKTRLNRAQKFFLSTFLKFAYKFVRCREETKSILVKSHDELRRAFDTLAEKLVYEDKKLPDTDLIYFLQLNEIKQLLQKRSPELVALANIRRKVFTSLDNLDFEEMILGPEMRARNDPRNIKRLKEITNSKKYNASIVSRGIVKAKVFVARTLGEASDIQKGDILVTHSTDIGWSPYFPVISGLITEIGGLISHGAVIAREYGLPCVVGLKDACLLFNTGETIILNADEGYILRVDQIDESKDDPNKETMSASEDK